MNMNLNVKFQNQRRCKIVNVIWSWYITIK
jgi:hypothetical protein